MSLQPGRSSVGGGGFEPLWYDRLYARLAADLDRLTRCGYGQVYQR